MVRPEEARRRRKKKKRKADAQLRARLERFYAAYQPEKLEDPSHLDKLVDKVGGASNEKKVEQLFGMLVKKYGPEPEAEAEAEEEDEDAELRARLVRFYKKYQPSKLGDVPKLVAKARGGQEEALFGMLVKKYGPEPDAEEEEEEEDDEEEDEEPEEDEYGLGLPHGCALRTAFRPMQYGPAFDRRAMAREEPPDLVLATKSGATVSEYVLARAERLSLDADEKINVVKESRARRERKEGWYQGGD